MLPDQKPSNRKFGRYEVEAEIGDGAMGRVYRGFDPLVRRPVAIKTVKSELLTRDTAAEYLKRFKREAQAAGGLSHPHIVGIFDVGEDYFVMEFLEGTTLDRLIKDRGKLDLGETLRLLGPAADALDFAHRSGIIHRDIKPANIMVLADGRPKLMDFGVAHFESSVMTQKGELLGSPSYMAPEQIKGEEVTPRADLYALAVVAYEALTGRRPFQGDNITSIIYRVVNEAPHPPRHWNVDLPPHYDDVFARALNKDPGRRYETASAFLAALGLKEIDQTLAALMPTLPPTPVAPPPPASPEPAAERAPELETHALPPPGAASAGPTADSRLPWIVAGGAVAALLVALVVPRLATPPPAAEAPAPVAASLTVQTEPAGARVTVDGQDVGRSPLTVRRVAPGVHKVRVAEDGYAPAELSLEVVSGLQMPPLRFALQAVAPPATELPEQPKPAPVKVVATHAKPGPEPTAPPLVEGALVEMGPGVLPPRKLAGNPAPYPEVAKRLRMLGSVVVEMTVTETGEVADPRVVESAGDILDQAVLAAVRAWRYEPGSKDGVKVKIRVRYRQTFQPAA